MKLFDWITLKIKRLLIRVVSPDLKGIDMYWNTIDPQDRYFAWFVLGWCVLFTGFIAWWVWLL